MKRPNDDATLVDTLSMQSSCFSSKYFLLTLDLLEEASLGGAIAPLARIGHKIFFKLNPTVSCELELPTIAKLYWIYTLMQSRDLRPTSKQPLVERVKNWTRRMRFPSFS
jgi:hypothetical protein